MIKIKNKVIIIFIIIFIICLIISSYFLFKEVIEYKKNLELNKNLLQKVTINENLNKENEKSFEIDFLKLEEINQDIIGWIKIDDTNINYPILKDNGNLIYLNKSYDKSNNKNGAIFTLNINPFEDNLTSLYGHNMKSGLMFSNLGNYMDRDFFYNHQEFIIYTKSKNYKAIVFSAYSIDIKDEEENLNNLSFKEEINYYKKSSVYKCKNVENIEKILKLSTCSYINNHTNPTNQRYYVVAKLENLN